MHKRSFILVCVVIPVFFLTFGESPASWLDRPLVPAVPSFPYLLGSFSTALDSDADRTHNIGLCVRQLNNRVIPPAGRFSFNHAVGPRSAKRGFRKAPVLYFDDMERLVGGGVCQVSTTLYNAALLADLIIVKRTKHSSRVYYVPPGQDATVSYGYRDLVLRSSFDFPIQIKAATTPTELMISIYGRGPLPYEVRLERRTREVAPPFDSPTARPGLEIQLYRLRFEDSVEVSRELVSVDVFPPVHDWKEASEFESSADVDGSDGLEN
ncbi:MAG: VanW family protein [Deltaproteobacteria bacterium]|nr:VanW family protein [Deltaproteobacteria bacterium]